ncbi:MAG: esterase-like activity of phytase family protein [Pseudomonadota bacterium]
MTPFRWAVAVILCLATLTTSPKAQADDPVTITSEPITRFGIGNTFGALTYLGGAVLSSDDERFGGFSGLSVDAETGRVIAVTDQGAWLQATLRIDDDGTPQLRNSQMGAMLNADGKPFPNKARADAEGLAPGVDGRLYASFERRHRVLIYRPGDQLFSAKGAWYALPETFRRLERNKGVEAIVAPPKEPGQKIPTLIGFSEARDEQGRVYGFIMRAREKHTFWLEGHERFAVTDADLTEDGHIILLERFFSPLTGPKMAVRRVRLEDIKPDATVSAEVLMTASFAQQIDNMEGLSITSGEDGKPILNIISDNNFNAIQRTLWLRFRLDG